MEIIIAGLALIVSVAAAVFTFHSAQHAKRQADAVLGDLPPIISLYQPPRTRVTSGAKLAIEIANHNRRPLYVTKWSFDLDEDLVIAGDLDDERGTLNIIRALRRGERVLDYDIGMRLPGAVQHVPQVETAIYSVLRKDGGTPSTPFTVGLTVQYRIDGDHELQIETRKMTWIPAEEKLPE